MTPTLLPHPRAPLVPWPVDDVDGVVARVSGAVPPLPPDQNVAPDSLQCGVCRGVGPKCGPAGARCGTEDATRWQALSAGKPCLVQAKAPMNKTRVSRLQSRYGGPSHSSRSLEPTLPPPPHLPGGPIQR
eukprot:3172587-Pyramimonas_sp.AAC.1